MHIHFYAMCNNSIFWKKLQLIKMIKNKKVQKLIIQNNIQYDNYTLVIRLKKFVQDLNLKIKEQCETIAMLKRDTKTTKISEMQVEIQHLNDQNKRLIIIIEELKNKGKTTNILSSKKNFIQPKNDQKRSIQTEQNYQNKIYDILKENEMLKKQLLNLKVNQSSVKKRKSTINDRNSIFIQKNLIDYEKLNQKKLDLQAQQMIMIERIKNLESKVNDLTLKNYELQKQNKEYAKASQKKIYDQ